MISGEHSSDRIANHGWVDAQHVEDGELLSRYIKNGDRDAIGVLFARHADAAYSLAHRFLRGSSDAEDAVQNAFALVFQNACKFRHGEGTNVKTWILGFVANVCRRQVRDESRRQVRQERITGFEAIGAEKRPDDNQEVKQVIRDAVDRLPDIYRMPVWLRYYEGLSSVDISRVLGVREGTIRTQIVRGIEQLRESMATTGYAMSITAITEALATVPGEIAPPALTSTLSNMAMHTTPGAVGADATISSFSSAAPALGTAIKAAIGVVCLGAVVGTVAVVAQKKGVIPGNTMPRLIAGVAGKDKVPLGSPNFFPSPEHPVGWRGDWTGRFPGATPPTEWYRRPTGPLNGMRASAAKPKGGDPAKDGTVVTHGLMTEWLQLGPFTPADGKPALDQEFISNEGAVRPDENEKTGSLTWGVKPKTGKINSEWQIHSSPWGVRVMAQAPDQVYYLHSYVYAVSDGSVDYSASHSQNGIKMWVNGKVVFSEAGRNCDDPRNIKNLSLKLVKGWNSFLFKLQAGAGSFPDYRGGRLTGCSFNNQLIPSPGTPFEVKNILWMTKMPAFAEINMNTSTPIIVGDKIFMISDLYDLVCVNKSDGKILWIKSNTYFDTMTEEERKANPDLVEKLQALDKKGAELRARIVKEINACISPNGMPSDTYKSIAGLGGLLSSNRANQAQIAGLMAKVDRKKYCSANYFGGNSSPQTYCTPCSDGVGVYAWYSVAGIAACYDMDGNRKWIVTYGGGLHTEHSNASSPLVAGGKLVVEAVGGLTAFDTRTGELVWHTPHPKEPGLLPVRYDHSLGSLNSFMIGSTPVVMHGAGLILQLADGKPLMHLRLNNGFDTPLVENGQIYHLSEANGMNGVDVSVTKLPADISGKAQVLKSFRFTPEGSRGFGINASVLCHEGLTYAFEYQGVFDAINALQGQVLYSKQLDMAPSIDRDPDPGCSASPALAGKYIYVTDNHNVTYVLEPGREFKYVARNVIDCEQSHEGTLACLVFDGNRMYLRSSEYLYCIGEK